MSKSISAYLTGSLVLIALLYAPGAFAQVTQEWVARYNGTSNSMDLCYAITLDEAGNVYVTGSTYTLSTGCNGLTMKYNAAGELLWTAIYNGSLNMEDYLYAVEVDADGIQAKLKDGILTVTLPKSKKSKSQSIEVKAE